MKDILDYRVCGLFRLNQTLRSLNLRRIRTASPTIN